MTRSPIPPAVSCHLSTGGGHGTSRLSARATEDSVCLADAPGWRVEATVIGSSPQAAVVTSGDLTVLLVGEVKDSDGPEAVLRLYRDLGPWAFSQLSGRFAAVVVHTSQSHITVSGDHAGTVPLYMVHTWDGVIEVATEAKVLAGLSERGRPILGTDEVPGLRGVRRLRAGTCVTLQARGVGRFQDTWNVPAHRETVDPDEAVAQVRAVIEDAVRWQARDEMTTVLSGGIDSSAVAATVKQHLGGVSTVTMGTDRSDEFDSAAVVATHLGSSHREFSTTVASVLAELPFVIALTECCDPSINEYMLPLSRLYREIPAGSRVMTGYGADIPLGGMHRGLADMDLEELIVDDLSTFDGLNELSPNLGTHLGLWTCHPYWDRAVLQRLVTLAAGLKRRDGIDKWVLRQAFSDLLPAETVLRPKLGIHEGSGTTSHWSEVLLDQGVPSERIHAAKAQISQDVFDLVVVQAQDPAEIDLAAVTAGIVDREQVSA
ncbi:MULTISPECIES: asparagine synthase-related protein [unclassified Knoellia]|uniref:asparagine synthase-related protein n=1 Tax=Knoellia altitudinis TaxID=3404795 RepID=UPI00361E0C1F